MTIKEINLKDRKLTLFDGDSEIVHQVSLNVDVRWNGGAVRFLDLKPGLNCKLAFSRREVSKIYAMGKG